MTHPTPSPLSAEQIAKFERILKTAQRGDYLDNAFSWQDIEQMMATIRAQRPGVMPTEDKAMEQATEIPMDNCGLTINAGRDGTWLHFTAKSGKSAGINVENWANSKDGGITAQTLRDWAADRQDQRNDPAAHLSPQGVGERGWEDISTAPKSISTPSPHGPYVKAICLLGFCPDEGAKPEDCISVIWWEPHYYGGDKGAWTDGHIEVRPTMWRLLPSPPAAG